jgi:hypothetical protein
MLDLPCHHKMSHWCADRFASIAFGKDVITGCLPNVNGKHTLLLTGQFGMAREFMAALGA